MRFPDFIDKQALATPGAVAVIFKDRQVTYADLCARSRKVAAALIETGLDAGAKVATWLTNSPEFFDIQIGIHRTHYVWMPLNSRATSAECITHLANFGAQWLFIDGDFSSDLATIMDAVVSLRGAVVVNGSHPGYQSLDRFSDVVSDYPDADVKAQDYVTLVTTGGTTGRPKGIMRLSANWATLVTNYRLALPSSSPPINMAVTPLTHVAGDIALSVFAQGGLNVVLERPRPDEILEAIEKYSVTSLFLPPTLLYMLLASARLPSYDLKSLQYMMYGAAPISREKLGQAWDVFGPVMTQLYGLMEATSTVSIMTPQEHTAGLGTNRFGSIGRGSPMVAIEVVDQNGRPALPGEAGEIVCRGDNLCGGYENNEEATQSAFRKGWFYTGDIGIKDDDGYIRIVDRSKDIIISGGINIYPGDVEQVLWGHPAVQDCAVIGMPDEKWGEAVTAVIELKPGQTVETGALLGLCREKLEAFGRRKTSSFGPSCRAVASARSSSGKCWPV